MSRVVLLALGQIVTGKDGKLVEGTRTKNAFAGVKKCVVVEVTPLEAFDMCSRFAFGLSGTAKLPKTRPRLSVGTEKKVSLRAKRNNTATAVRWKIHRPCVLCGCTVLWRRPQPAKGPVAPSF